MAASKSTVVNDVFVATDDPRIESAVKQHGGKTIITTGDHQTGSDRVAEAVEQFPDAEYIVNIQGDEPFISAGIINKVASALDDSEVVMSTACAPFSDPSAADDPNIVKVVLDRSGDALYFSRSRIPYNRVDGGEKDVLYRHIGIYGFKREFLAKYASLDRSPLEKAESLEQLRALENGYKIRTIIDNWDFPGIDSKEDLIRAELILGEKEKQNG